MVIFDLEFEWNEGKEKINILKHRYSFEDAKKCFLDPNGFRLVDKKHSLHEDRNFWIGKFNDKILTVRFIIRKSKIRIIGCAEWRSFRKVYYEKAKNK